MRGRAKKWIRRLLIVVGIWLGFAFVLSVIIVAYGETDHGQPADVIVVLGAGLRRDGTRGSALTRRATHAVILYEQGYADNIICSGGFPSQFIVRSEADACRELLVERGVPADAITLEEQSRSTEENAVYSKVIMEERGWQTAIVVSDPFHVFRADIIFSQFGITHTSSAGVSPPLAQYVPAVMREVVALHWQLIKTILNLPYTYVPWL